MWLSRKGAGPNSSVIRLLFAFVGSRFYTAECVKFSFLAAAKNSKDSHRLVDCLQAVDKIAQLAATAMILPENRFYCPHIACSSLIEAEPGLAARQPKQWCWECSIWMCIQCKTAWLESVSCDRNMQDPHTIQLLHMASSQGLAQCPQCGFVLHRSQVSRHTLLLLGVHPGLVYRLHLTQHQ